MFGALYQPNHTNGGSCHGGSSDVIHLKGLDITEDFLPLRLGRSDVILGMQWLDTLGLMKTNWKEQTMEFEVGG